MNSASYIIIGTITLIPARTKVNRTSVCKQIKGKFADFARRSSRPEERSEFVGAGSAGSAGGPGFCRHCLGDFGPFPLASLSLQVHLSPRSPQNMPPPAAGVGVLLRVAFSWVWKCDPHSANPLFPDLYICLFSPAAF